MVEPPQLLSAREHLALAEAKYRSEDGLFHLEEGLGLLEEVMAGTSSAQRAVAQNLAATYSMKICNVVKNLATGNVTWDLGPDTNVVTYTNKSIDP